MTRPAPPHSDAAHLVITTELVRLCLASSAAPARPELAFADTSTAALDRRARSTATDAQYAAVRSNRQARGIRRSR